MKVKFKTKELEDFYATPLDDIKGKLPVQKEIIRQFKRKIQILVNIDSLAELKKFKSLHFEALKGNREGEYSVRLNKQYRLIFTIEGEKNDVPGIEVVIINGISKHYEK